MSTIALNADHPIVYADASALVKLVVEEPESDALSEFVSSLDRSLVTSRVALVEVVRAATIANPNPDVRDEAERLVRSCALVNVTDAVLRDAARRASRELRTLDAIHLVSAVRVDAEVLLVYDRRLRDAALDDGLAVVSPGE